MFLDFIIFCSYFYLYYYYYYFILFLFFSFCYKARKDERFAVSSYVKTISSLDFLMKRTARIIIQIEPDLSFPAQKLTLEPKDRQGNLASYKVNLIFLTQPKSLYLS